MIYTKADRPQTWTLAFISNLSWEHKTKTLPDQRYVAHLKATRKLSWSCTPYVFIDLNSNKYGKASWFLSKEIMNLKLSECLVSFSLALAVFPLTSNNCHHDLLLKPHLCSCHSFVFTNLHAGFLYQCSFQASLWSYSWTVNKHTGSGAKMAILRC